MKKFTFKGLSTMFVIALLSLMTACGGGTGEQADAGNTGDSSSGGEASGGLNEKIVIKFGHHLADNHSLGEQVTYFAELVDEKSNGMIEIDVYSNGQLGDQRALLEGLQMGTVDMSLGDTAVMANLATDVGVLDLPYVFDSIEHAKKALLDGELGEKLKEAILEQTGIRTLVIEPLAYRGTVLAEGKKVESFEDFAGLKLRTLDAPQIVDTFTAFGVQPVALPTGEALSAMQTGVVDGLESNAEFLATISIWEVGKYWIDTQHNLTSQTINISDKVFNELPEEARNIIVEALNETVDWFLDHTVQRTEESLDRFLAEGMEFIEMDITPFKETAAPVVDKFVKDNGFEEYIQLIDNARE